MTALERRLTRARGLALERGWRELAGGFGLVIEAIKQRRTGCFALLYGLEPYVQLLEEQARSGEVEYPELGIKGLL